MEPKTCTKVVMGKGSMHSSKWRKPFWLSTVCIYECVLGRSKIQEAKEAGSGQRILDIWGVLWEKAMAPHSGTLAWKIPWTEEPGRPQSMGSLGIRHDWATSLSHFTFMHWGRTWQPTPVFLPGESQGRGSLVGYRLWGHTVGHDWSDLAAAEFI